MRKRTVRSGLRFMIAGIVCIILATFFPAQMSTLLFLGLPDEAHVSFLGFFVGGVCAGWGIVMTAIGIMQSGIDDIRVRLMPTIMLLFSLVILFFVLAYSSVSRPQPPHLEPGESVNI
jgi:hypothetical protein